MSEFECTPVEVCREKRNGEEWHNVTVRKAKDGTKTKFSYREAGDVGKGTFGTVRKILTHEGQTYALKRLEHDPRFKNREVAIMRELDHTNCCRLFYYYSEKTETGKPEMCINLVMEFVSDTLSSIVSRSRKQTEDISPFMIQVYLYQLLRGTAYMHSKKIAHRDIKPQNILIESSTALLKICDFGSAKRLTEGEPNVAYICSRFYRAPELILGNTHYDVSVDTWAIGCVFAEMFLLKPIFVGDSSIDQLTEIIRVLGTPTPEQMDKLHPKFPKTLKKRDPVPLIKALKNKPSTKAIRLLTKMLQYMPDTRIRCWEALAEPFFDDLRKPSVRLPDSRPLPPLFDFTTRELEQNPILNQLLLPSDIQDSPQQALFHVYTASDCLKFGPVWIPQVPIPSQFMPGLTSNDSSGANDISSVRRSTEISSRRGSDISSGAWLPKDTSEQNTSKTFYEHRLISNASDPTTTRICPGLPPSVDASEQNTTRTYLARMGIDASDPNTTRTFRQVVPLTDASDTNTARTCRSINPLVDGLDPSSAKVIPLPAPPSIDTSDLSTAKSFRIPVPSIDLSEPNTNITSVEQRSSKKPSKKIAVKTPSHDSTTKPSRKRTPPKISSPDEITEVSTDANTEHTCTEQCYADSSNDTPSTEQRGAGVTCRTRRERSAPKRLTTQITDFCFVTIKSEHPHELVRHYRNPALSAPRANAVRVKGLNYKYVKEKDRKLFAELPRLAEQVGISSEGALALARLIVKHKPKLKEGSNSDVDLIDRETAKAKEKIKKDAAEVMSEDDIAKLDDILAILQRKRADYRARCGWKGSS